MIGVSLFRNPQAMRLKKIRDFLFTALLFAVVILVLSYFFHRGAELVAEIVING